MKKFLLMSLLCVSLTNYAQEWTKKVNDPYFHKTLSKGLKVGDKMPDLQLRAVINGIPGKTKLSDFKGKLVILDFWSTSCGPCMSKFPKMEKLQRDFGNKIQIILINTSQTEDTIKDYYAKYRKDKFPDLPCIVKDSAGTSKLLEKLLPTRSLGHQVWIDKHGVVKLRGLGMNTNSKKIADFLDGKDIFILNDSGTTPNFDSECIYYKLLPDFKTVAVNYSSVFTPFNNEYNVESIGSVDNVSEGATRRNTYINIPIHQLYDKVFDVELREFFNTTLYSPNPFIKAYLKGNYILPLDTMRYFPVSTDDDSIYRMSRVCYEQIVPVELSVEKQKQYMLEDLNRYCGSLYGTKVTVEKRKVKCYVLVRTSNIDRLRTKSNVTDYGTVAIKNQSYQYRNTYLGAIGDHILESKDLYNLFRRHQREGRALFLMNETGFDKNKKIDIDFPLGDNLKSMGDFRKALKPYDLDIKEAEREINFIVFRDNSNFSVLPTKNKQ